MTIKIWRCKDCKWLSKKDHSEVGFLRWCDLHDKDLEGSNVEKLVCPLQSWNNAIQLIKDKNEEIGKERAKYNRLHEVLWRQYKGWILYHQRSFTEFLIHVETNLGIINKSREDMER